MPLMSLYAQDGAIGTNAHTLLAADAVVGVLNTDVAVSEKINLSEHVFGTGVEAIPARYTVVRVYRNVGRLSAVTKFVKDIHSYYNY